MWLTPSRSITAHRPPRGVAVWFVGENFLSAVRSGNNGGITALTAVGSTGFGAVENVQGGGYFVGRVPPPRARAGTRV